MDLLIDVLKDTLLDTARLFPFLFITYLLMEFLEHHTESKSLGMLKKSGKLGPLIGSIAGLFPQCGFSAAAANLYAGRVISMGTLIAVFLSTSDEMLPMMISNQMPAKTILMILATKLIVGLLAGLVVDLVIHLMHKDDNAFHIHEFCETENCHCENGIFKSALIHSIKVTVFIMVLTFAINYFMACIGEQGIEYVTMGESVGIVFLASIVGLIPNCAASVALTQVYLYGALSEGALIAGLLVGAGVGLLVLFRVNKRFLENLKIVAILWVIGFLTGCLINLLGINFLPVTM